LRFPVPSQINTSAGLIRHCAGSALPFDNRHIPFICDLFRLRRVVAKGACFRTQNSTICSEEAGCRAFHFVC
ncbi:hypothetical protein ACCS64_39725, partial [Rhizobium ruizarguesonis]